MDAYTATRLDIRGWTESMAVMETFDELEDYAQHAGAVVARLEYLNSEVRREAMKTLGGLEPEMLAQHAGAVVARLRDIDDEVRREAVKTLGGLEPATLAQHAGAVVAMLKDTHDFVRTAALETLGKLEPMTLVQHAPAVIARLGDSDYDVRQAAVETLRKLEPATLTQYVPSMIESIRWGQTDDRSSVRAPWVRWGQTDDRPSAWGDYDPNSHPLFANLKMGMEGISLDRVRARLSWLHVRALFRAQRLAQWWLAYIYEPGRLGFYRTLEEFGDLAKRQKAEKA